MSRNRFTWVLGVLLSLLPAAPSAKAEVSFEITRISGVSTEALSGGEAVILPALGDQFTVDLRVRADGQDLFGLNASAFGYDPSLVSFVSGTAVDFYLSESCAVPIVCFGAFENLAGGTLSESAPGIVPIAATPRESVGRSSIGIDDPGLDGIVGGGGAQFSLVFQVVGFGATEIEFGTGAAPGDGVFGANGAVTSANNASVVLPVPEPGTMAFCAVGFSWMSMLRRPSRFVRVGTR